MFLPTNASFKLREQACWKDSCQVGIQSLHVFGCGRRRRSRSLMATNVTESRDTSAQVGAAA